MPPTFVQAGRSQENEHCFSHVGNWQIFPFSLSFAYAPCHHSFWLRIRMKDYKTTDNLQIVATISAMFLISDITSMDTEFEHKM